MKGFLERALIIGCDVLLDDGTQCPRLLILNNGADQPTEAHDAYLRRQRWTEIPSADSDPMPEHACYQHTVELGLLPTPEEVRSVLAALDEALA